MQWIVLNAVGALSWVAGLLVAKGVNLPPGDFIIADDHRLMTGLVFSLAGLVLLLWANFRAPA